MKSCSCIMTSLLIFLCISCSYFSRAQHKIDKLAPFETGQFVDPRDQRTYAIIHIDSLWWFNENLNFNSINSHCFKDQEQYCQSLGRLYSYEEAQYVCPAGWRLPTEGDFNQLMGNLNAEHIVGSLYHFHMLWPDLVRPSSLGGFKLFRAGWKHKRKYQASGSYNMWINSMKKAVSHAHMYEFGEKTRKNPNKVIAFIHQHEKHNAIRDKRKFSVRCVKP